MGHCAQHTPSQRFATAITYLPHTFWNPLAIHSKIHKHIRLEKPFFFLNFATLENIKKKYGQCLENSH